MKQPVVHIRAYTHDELLRLTGDDPQTLAWWLADEFADATATAGIATHKSVLYTVQAVMPPAEPMDPVSLEAISNNLVRFVLPPGCDARKWAHPCNIADADMREAAYDEWAGAFDLDIDQDVWCLGVPYTVVRYGHTDDSREFEPHREAPEAAAASGAPYNGRVWLRRKQGGAVPRSVALELLEDAAPSKHGEYDIVESFATDANQLVFLAYSRHAFDPWVTGVYQGAGGGSYFAQEDDARRDFAKRITHSLGLQVGDRSSLVLHEKQVGILAFNAMELLHQVVRVRENPDDEDQRAALEEMAEAGAANWVKLINGDTTALEKMPQPQPQPVGMNAAEFITAVYNDENFNREGNKG